MKLTRTIAIVFLASLTLLCAALDAQVKPTVTTNADVIRMVKAGIPDAEIVAIIRSTLPRYRFSEIDDLVKAGISDEVFHAMATRADAELPADEDPEIAVQAGTPGITAGHPGDWGGEYTAEVPAFTIQGGGWTDIPKAAPLPERQAIQPVARSFSLPVPDATQFRYVPSSSFLPEPPPQQQPKMSGWEKAWWVTRMVSNFIPAPRPVIIIRKRR